MNKNISRNNKFLMLLTAFMLFAISMTVMSVAIVVSGF